MPQDLKLDGNQINIALACFFPAYIIFNVPANLLIKKLRPHVFREPIIPRLKQSVTDFGFILVPCCMLLFGTMTVVQGLGRLFELLVLFGDIPN